jgi:hypothetical protein
MTDISDKPHKISQFISAKFTYDENGQFHSYNDRPSHIHIDETKEWHFHGLLHRENDLPAVEYDSGYKAWYKFGKRHRDNDKPARTAENGWMEFYVDDKLHRDMNLGPAVICLDGTKVYYENSELIKIVCPYGE